MMLVLPVALALALSCCATCDPLANPGFEIGGADGAPVRWTVLTDLDPHGYGSPDYKDRFSVLRPMQVAGGRAGSRSAAGFPAEGTWTGSIRDHRLPDGKPGIDGEAFGKAALYQTVDLEPGCYVFGAYLRTAGGDAYSAAFSLGVSHGSDARYANDGSTGIAWTGHNLGLRTSFDGTGGLKERGEWYRYQTDTFEVRVRGTVTVWIRFNYANNNSVPARWQVDDAFLIPCPESSSPSAVPVVEPYLGAPLRFPAQGQVVVDCGDGDEGYLRSAASRIRGDIPGDILQHGRAVFGGDAIRYSVPLDPSLPVVYLAFEHTGPFRLRSAGRVIGEDAGANPDVAYPREYVLTDRSLWRSGKLDLVFSSARLSAPLTLIWLEAGSTTRYRERLNNIEWDTTGVPWRIGLWDSTPNEFRGEGTLVRPGVSKCEDLSPASLLVEWPQRPRPGRRYILALGHIRRNDGIASINIGEDETVEYISRTDGEEVLNFDITEFLKQGQNRVSLKADAIDFAALIETHPGATDNRRLRLYFGGDDLADNLTRVLHNSLFWVLSLHFDGSGFLDASVPHGKWWNQYWPIDISFALRSLLHWGQIPEAERAAVLAAQVGWGGHSSNRSGAADNNGGSIIAADMCELLRRSRFRIDVTGALWPCVRQYCDDICNEAATSPFGLIKGTNWENAGNLKEGPCYSLSTNLLARYLLLKASETADEGKLEGNAAVWRTTAGTLRRQVLERLVFRSDTPSPTGWLYPEGTWAYGLKDSGSFMLQPLAGYLWAGPHGSSLFGFANPDDEVLDLYRKTLEVALPLFDRGYRGLVSGYAESYDGAAVTFGVAALADDLQAMSRLIEDLAADTDYREDGGSTRAEVSRWAWGSAGGVEDTNLVGVGEFLDWPRFVVGIDDLLRDGRQVRIIPRLPSRWNQCGVNDWSIEYLKAGQRASTTLTFDYRTAPGEVSMRIRTGNPVKGMSVRLGPFPLESESLICRINGKPLAGERVISGGRAWLWVNLDALDRWTVLTARCGVDD